MALINAAAGAVTPALPFKRPAVKKIPGYTRLEFPVDFAAFPFTPIDLTGFPPESDPDIETLGRMDGSTVELVIGKDLPLSSTPVVQAARQLDDVAEG